MKTDIYCYMENRTKLALPSGVPGYPAFDDWLDPAYTAVLEIDMHRGHVGEDDRLTLAVPRLGSGFLPTIASRPSAEGLGSQSSMSSTGSELGGSTTSTTGNTTGWPIGGCSITSM